MISQNSELKSQSQNSKDKSELKKRCYDYSIETIKFIDSLPAKRINWVISNQLLRSATSIGANVTEAKSASSKKDFIRFYEIALKSANETKYWLGLFKDALNIDGNVINYLLKETDELTRIIASSLLTLKNKNKF
jgi:four helix bundle protein